ncbi:MAG: hypothetical protein K8R36_12825 [Planctomycetales bacterium]|nr:hypothetical protein [Planctomycetales bacterium]
MKFKLNIRFVPVAMGTLLLTAAIAVAVCRPAIGLAGAPAAATAEKAPAKVAEKAAEKAPEKIAPSTVTPKIGEAGREAVLAYRLKNYVPSEMKIGDGYVDGGRGMKMHGDGRVSSSREVITVDRTRDADLRKQLEFARSPELMKLNPLDRATRLARQVALLMTPKEGYRQLEAKTEILDKEHSNKEVLIGDVPKITGGAGVCRHRSLLFKLMADEAGLKVSLVRGRYGRNPSKLGPHAWNELRLDDGSVLIVDVTNPQPDFHFPDDKSKQAGRYYNLARQPYYPGPTKPVEKPQAAK